MRNFLATRLSLLAVVLLCATVSNSAAEDLIAVDAALKKMYSSATNFARQDIDLSPEDVAGIETESGIAFSGAHSAHVIQYTARQQDNLIGYAFEDTVMGKWGPIHYLVGITTQGVVADVMVLGYQEIRGRPIAKRRFLGQYRGKQITDPLRLQADINGVTGATISSRSITEGIRKLLYVFKALKTG